MYITYHNECHVNYEFKAELLSDCCNREVLLPIHYYHNIYFLYHQESTSELLLVQILSQL